MGLRTKFNLVMLGTFLLGIGLAGAAAYEILLRNAEQEVIAKARIMRESALAMRRYTAEELRPLLEAAGGDEFRPHTVPSFAAQTNFRQIQLAFPDYSYKEAALNPTNPADRATDWEADIISVFRNDPDQAELTVMRDTPTGRVLSLAHPIRIEDEGCLVCHSTPAAAPPSMVALYGTANGFGWQMGETIGAQIVSVPLSVPMERARHAFAIFMGSLVGVFVVLGLLLNLLLHRVVVRPVVRMATAAEAVSLGDVDVPEFEAGGRDEIARLSASFNRLRRSLVSALRLIDGDTR